jgi:hypothetical protein
MSLILSGTDGLSDVDGSASTPAIRGTDTNTGIFFPAADTIAFAEGGTESMRLDSSGNVIVGSTSATTGDRIVQTKTYDGDNGYGGDRTAVVVADSTVRGSLQAHSGGSQIIFGTETAHNLNFITSNSGRMLINSTGVVGINQDANAYAQLAVRFNPSGSANNSTGFSVQPDAGTSNARLIFFYNETGNGMGSITRNGTSNAVLYNTSSDYRLKENVLPMTGALAKVQSLKPVTWTWIDGGQAGEGFIAHEVQEIVPSAVSGDKDAVDANGKPKYQGMDASYLVATLTAAIQEQTAIITDLKSRIEQLEAK